MKRGQRQPTEYKQLLREHLQRLSLVSREAWTLYDKAGRGKTDEKIRLLRIIVEIDVAWSRLLESLPVADPEGFLESQRTHKPRGALRYAA